MAEQNLNIQKVKDNTTISRTTISNLYNNNGSGVQFDTLGQLCKLLNCQPGDLFTYVDISTDFEEIQSKRSNIELDLGKMLEVFRENNGVDQSDNKIVLNILCKLEYEGEKIEFEFSAHLNFRFKTEFIIEIDRTISETYRSKLDSLKLPFYVEDYVKERLDEFLINWTSEKCDEELDGYAITQYYFDFK